MENSSKALLIAAAVLIVIILIALGVRIFNSSNNVDKQAQSVGESISNATKDAALQFESSFDIDRESASSGSSGITGEISGGAIEDIPIQEENITQEETRIAMRTEEGVPIPVGFKYVTGTKATGVVIENETEGSQFVWVPVTTDIAAYGLGTGGRREPDVVTRVTPSETVDSASGTALDAIKANLTLAGCIEDLNNDNVVNAYDFKLQLTNEFNKMAASVNKYDGYYVGRYEVSLNAGKTAQSKGCTTGGKEVKSATAAADSANTWYGLYALCKTYNTSSVASSMIWGSQYDAMMTWMGDAAETKIGNNKNKTRYTGSVETDKINNIYDLYGNCLEWTLETNGSYGRSLRGGGGPFQDDSSPSVRGLYNPDNTNSDMNSGYGSRLVLYIV